MKAHIILIILLTAFSVNAQKKNTSYSKIYKLTKIDRTVEYGSKEFKDTAEERSFYSEKKKELEEEYKAATAEYKTAFNEYRKSKEKDKKPPSRIYKPSYQLESKKYSSDKDKERMEKLLAKKNESAEKSNAKILNR